MRSSRPVLILRISSRMRVSADSVESVRNFRVSSWRATARWGRTGHLSRSHAASSSLSLDACTCGGTILTAHMDMRQWRPSSPFTPPMQGRRGGGDSGVLTGGGRYLGVVVGQLRWDDGVVALLHQGLHEFRGFSAHLCHKHDGKRTAAHTYHRYPKLPRQA